MLNIFSLAHIIISILAAVKCDCDMYNFSKDEIVPHIIPDWPNQPLEVIYSNNKSITCGETVPSALLSFPPDIDFQANDRKYYALLMSYIDRPLYHIPMVSPFPEWMIVNIPGNNLEKGEVKRKYTSPFLLPNSSSHRIMFFVFEQWAYLKNYTYIDTGDRISLNRWMQEVRISAFTAGNYAFVKPELDETFATILGQKFDELRDDN